MSSPVKERISIFVARETSALSLGAEDVVAAIQAEAETRKLDVEIVRPGSRGLTWAEPMVEVDIAGERIAFGPVTPADVAGLFEAGFLEGGEHALSLGPTADIPYLKNQTRLTFNNVMDGFPVWSPDGIRIAFMSRREGNNAIYTMNADGSNQTRLT
ncbi:MAG: PD40 domain-containing protein, partial [Proteobacteria bacterium]|nr:PD40 domain-containing protein [Pseudomonadota bacterium]